MILRVFNILSGEFSLGSPIFARKRYFCENFGVFRLSDVFSMRFSFRQRLFGVFSGKRQSKPTRNVKTKKPKATETPTAFTARFSSFVPICALPASICYRRINFRRFRLFGRILRAFTGALPQSRRRELFKRVFRRFTSLYAPVKEDSLPLSQASI